MIIYIINIICIGVDTTESSVNDIDRRFGDTYIETVEEKVGIKLKGE